MSFSDTLNPALTWRHFEVIDSTNTYLLYAEQPINQLISTDKQRKGRGRHGQRWFDNTNSLLFSLSTGFVPDKDLSAWPVQLSIVVADVLDALGRCLASRRDQPSITAPDIRIKWPNDLYTKTHGQWGKFGGILVESQIGKIGKMVSGIGINLSAINVSENMDYPFIHLDLPVKKQRLLFILANELFAAWQRFVEQPVIEPEAYQAYDYVLNKKLIATDMGSGKRLCGTGSGVNHQGQLMLRNSQGRFALTSQQRIRLLD